MAHISSFKPRICRSRRPERRSDGLRRKPQNNMLSSQGRPDLWILFHSWPWTLDLNHDKMVKLNLRDAELRAVSDSESDYSV